MNYYIWYIAGSLTTISFIPQVFKSYKTMKYNLNSKIKKTLRN